MSEELKNQPAVDTGAAEEVSEQVAVRMDKMHKLEEKGILPFGHAYKVTHHNKEVHDKVKELEEKGAEVRVAGRVTARPLLWTFSISLVRFSYMSARMSWEKIITVWSNSWTLGISSA